VKKLIILTIVLCFVFSISIDSYAILFEEQLEEVIPEAMNLGEKYQNDSYWNLIGKTGHFFSKTITTNNNSIDGYVGFNTNYLYLILESQQASKQGFNLSQATKEKYINSDEFSISVNLQTEDFKAEELKPELFNVKIEVYDGDEYVNAKSPTQIFRKDVGSNSNLAWLSGQFIFKDYQFMMSLSDDRKYGELDKKIKLVVESQFGKHVFDINLGDIK